jgi:hypothetical protein
MKLGRKTLRTLETTTDERMATINYHCMLLANISRDDRAVRMLIKESQALQGLDVLRLLKWFVDDPVHLTAAQQRDPDLTGAAQPFQYVAYIIMNLTQLKSGRGILLDKDRGILKALAPHVESNNFIKKRGLISTLRNCLMDTKYHAAILDPETLLFQTALLAIVGPSGELDAEDRAKVFKFCSARMTATKRRDSDNTVRRLILDMILMCARHKASRIYLREHGTYYLLRELHKEERKRKVTEHDELIEDLVQYFLLPEEEQQKKKNEELKAQQAAAAARKEARRLAAEAKSESKCKIEVIEDEEDDNNNNNNNNALDAVAAATKAAAAVDDIVSKQEDVVAASATTKAQKKKSAADDDDDLMAWEKVLGGGAGDAGDFSEDDMSDVD